MKTLFHGDVRMMNFYYRMSVLSNRIGRIDNYVYHLEHSRTHNSWFSNPNFNNKLDSFGNTI